MSVAIMRPNGSCAAAYSFVASESLPASQIAAPMLLPLIPKTERSGRCGSYPADLR